MDTQAYSQVVEQSGFAHLTLAQSTGESSILVLIVGVVAIVIGLGLGVVLAGVLGGKKIDRLRNEADQLAGRAKADAETTADKILLDAERNALSRKESVDKELETARSEQRDVDRRLAKREDNLHRKEDNLADKEQTLLDRREQLDARKDQLKGRESEIDNLIEQQGRELERVGQIDRAQAKELLLERVAEQSRVEMGRVTRKIVEDAEDGAKDEAKEILINAIQRYANEHSSESTVRTVAIPSDDMKGRIIGREGRNIRAIEKATGADIIVDDTPGVIVVSCFDKVRQTIAVRSLEVLVTDGRMHPTRIEEVVDKVKSEVQEKIVKAGKDAVVELGLKGIHPKSSKQWVG